MSDPKQQSVTEWLLEPEVPVIRYRTLTELLGERRSSQEARSAKALIAQSADVLHVFSHLGPDGLFPHIPKYFASATTAYHLIALGRLGLDGSDLRMRPSVDRFLNEWRAHNHDYCTLTYCLGLRVLRALIQSGLVRDSRVAEWISIMEGNVLSGRARPCRNVTTAFQRNPRRPTTCFRASCKALAVYAALPESSRRKAVSEELAHSLLMSLGEANQEVPQGEFGVGASTLVHAFSVLGYGDRAALKPLWESVEELRDAEGRYRTEGTSHMKRVPRSKILIPSEAAGQPGKWVTLSVLLAQSVCSSAIHRT